MKMKKIWPRGGRASLAPPLDPPLSAIQVERINDQVKFCEKQKLKTQVSRIVKNVHCNFIQNKRRFHSCHSF